MDAIVEVLLEKETMTGDEFRAILSKYATMPQVRRGAALPLCTAVVSRDCAQATLKCCAGCLA